MAIFEQIAAILRDMWSVKLRSFLGLFLLCVLIFSNGCTITSMDQNESDSEFKNSEFPDQFELQ